MAMTNNKPALMLARATSGPKGTTAQAAKRRHDGHDGADAEQAFAGRGRHDDFLGQQLQRIRNRLQQARRADTVRAEASLHPDQATCAPTK
jgi:uncharacterized NAD(P)/FAD-binding protein YdhS